MHLNSVKIGVVVFNRHFFIYLDGPSIGVSLDRSRHTLLTKKWNQSHYDRTIVNFVRHQALWGSSGKVLPVHRYPHRFISCGWLSLPSWVGPKSLCNRKFLWHFGVVALLCMNFYRCWSFYQRNESNILPSVLKYVSEAKLHRTVNVSYLYTTCKQKKYIKWILLVAWSIYSCIYSPERIIKAGPLRYKQPIITLSQTSILYLIRYASVFLIVGIHLKDLSQQANIVGWKIFPHSGLEAATFRYNRTLLQRSIHHFKSDSIDDMDHMRNSSTDPSSVIFSQTIFLKCWKLCWKSAKTSWS